MRGVFGLVTFLMPMHMHLLLVKKYTQILTQALVSGKKKLVSGYIFFTRNKCLCHVCAHAMQCRLNNHHNLISLRTRR